MTKRDDRKQTALDALEKGIIAFLLFMSVSLLFFLVTFLALELIQ